MCETDRDHRAATALYGRGNRRRGGDTNGHHHHHHHLNGGHDEANGNNNMATTTRHVQEMDAPYKVQVSIRFLVTCLLASCLLAFCVGRAARILMLGQVVQQPSTAVSSDIMAPSLPSILVRNGKSVPQTRYLSKNFDTSMSASSSSWLAASRDASIMEEEEEEDNNAGVLTDTTHDEEEEQQPMAEHLMVDIKNVDSAFLNSERRLANAIIEVMEAANLTLLSYHCHGLVPMGVSCVGVLLQNYISFHTWPEEGVITLDLCVGGSRSLLPVLPILERAFGKPSIGSGKTPEMRWAHRVRGFSTHADDERQSHDLGVYVLGDLATDMKKEVFSVETNFQKLDIYDVKELNNERTSPLQKKSHDSRRAVVVRPDRVVMRDGWVESTLFHEAAYHEALVHPALFAHDDPKRVAIIGGGEGASLREVLKHKTVEEAVLLEIDETIVNVSKIHMPEWSDCSDLKGSAAWCIDDARTRLFHEDALEWFVDHYASSEASDAAPMDVVIMNALGAESETAYAEALYSNVTYMRSFYNSLSDDGVLVMQLGESPDSGDPDEMLSGDKNRVAALNLLETVGFESIHAYTESHCGFDAAWTFVVAFKRYATRKRWYANAAEVELAIRKRIVQTKSGNSPLRYFDGATMVSYQVPSRTIENVFCRRQPTPVGCDDDEYTFDPETPSVPTSSLEVKISGQGDNSGRGVFTKVDIEEETYVAPDSTPHELRFFPSTYALIMELLEKCEKEAEALEVVEYYMHGYGFSSHRLGTDEVFVDSSILTFVNHGCRGTYNVGEESDLDEFSVGIKSPMSQDLSGRSHVGTSVFNPVIDRHLFFSGDTTIRDIDAGEEVLDNYLAFIGSDKCWEEDVMDLRQQCSGQTTEGSVTDYEKYYDKDMEKGTDSKHGEEL